MEIPLQERSTRGSLMMKREILLLLLASLVVDTAVCRGSQTHTALVQELKESPGKEGLMLVVEYPPGK